LSLNDRVVVDRNHISGGGITAGLDFGLEIVQQIRAEEDRPADSNPPRIRSKGITRRWVAGTCRPEIGIKALGARSAAIDARSQSDADYARPRWIRADRTTLVQSASPVLMILDEGVSKHTLNSCLFRREQGRTPLMLAPMGRCCRARCPRFSHRADNRKSIKVRRINELVVAIACS
jgi:hypothetical protein